MSSSLETSGEAALVPMRKCILVVEDELLIRMMLSDELRDVGYQVIEASDADEALVILGAVGPDLIISDVRMPGSLDGLELLALVRNTHPTLPVIITSGHLPPKQALIEGATRFVAKPYSLEQVVQMAQDVIERPL